MTYGHKMERQDIVEVLVKGQWYLMFAFCTVFGVVTNESYLKLKYPDRKPWRNLFFKLVVAFFVCMLIHGWYDYKLYNKKYEYIPITLASFLHYQIGSWIRTSLFPLLTKVILNSLTGGKKDE